MSLSSVVSNLVRASMGSSVEPTVTDEDLDQHVRDLLIKEAKKRAERYSQQGIRAYLSSSISDSNAPKTNKRFLSSIIRSTDDHNKTILRAQAQAAEEIKRERREQEMKEKRARAEEAAAAERDRLRRGVTDTESWDRWNGRKGDRKRKSRDWEYCDDDSDDDDYHRPRRRHRHRHRDDGSKRHRRHRSRNHSASRSERRTSKRSERSSRRRSRSRDRSSRERKSRRSRSRSFDRKDKSRRSRSRSSDRRERKDRSRRSRSRSSDPRERKNKPRRSRSRSSEPKGKSRKSRSRSSECRPPSRHESPAPVKPPSPKPVLIEDDETLIQPVNIYSNKKASSSSSTLSSGMDLDSSRSPTPGPEPPMHPPSKMDKYFDESYDPRLDVAPLTVPKVPATGLINNAEFEGWDAMLDLLRQRREDKEEKKRLERMGYNKDEIKKVIATGSLSSASDRWNTSGTSIMNLEYKKRGAVREWDLGKEGV